MTALQIQLIFGVIGRWAKSEFESSSKSPKQAEQKNLNLFFSRLALIPIWNHDW